MSKQKKGLVPELRFPEFHNSEKWERDKLSKLISTITPPKKLLTSEYLLEGKFPIIDQSQSYICGWTNDNDALFKENLPLIIFGDHTCALKLINQPFAQGADGIKVLKPNDAILTEFIYQSLQNRPLVMEQYKRHFSTLKERQVAYPAGVREQQKIADCLASIDELITLHTKKLDAFKSHKKGLMQQLFPAEEETVPKLRFPEFCKAGSWKLKPIGKVLAEKQRPIDMADDAEYSLVTVKRRYGGLVSRGVYKGRSIKVKSQFEVHENDFLISKRQIVHCACGVVPKELHGSIVSNEYSVLVPRKDNDVHFFAYFAQQPRVSLSFLQCSIGIVIEKMLFKLKDWLTEEFLFPEIEEQQKIAQFLGDFDEIIDKQFQKVKSLKEHKKSLMQKLFPVIDEVV